MSGTLFGYWNLGLFTTLLMRAIATYAANKAFYFIKCFTPNIKIVYKNPLNDIKLAL